MKKNGNIKGLAKPLSTVLLSCLVAATLTSCKKGTNLYNGIDGDAKYLSVDKYNVTNKELFDELLFNGNTFIDSKMDEVILKDKLEEVKNTIEGEANDNKASYIKKVQEYLCIDVYKTSDFAAIKDAYKNLYLIKQNELKYIDQIYKDTSIKLSEASLAKLVKLNDSYEADIDYSSLNADEKAVFAKYYVNLAKKLFAADYLEDEIKEYNEDKKNTDPYFADSEIKSHYEDHNEKENPLNALVIRFINEAEVKQVFKTFGLKTYKSKLYLIRQNEREEAAELSDAEYSKYYDDFDFASSTASRDAHDLSQLASTGFMLSLYIELYNYIYSNRNQIPNIEGVDLTAAKDSPLSSRRKVTEALYDAFTTGETITAENVYENCIKKMDADELADYVTYDGKELDKISTSLQNYVYNTLKLENNKNYSQAGQSFGSYYYLAYKINEPVEDETKKLVYKDNAKTEIDREKNADLIESIIKELKEEKLTDSYISTALAEKKKDLKLNIYDETLEISYLAKNQETYSKTRKSAPSGDTLFTIKYDKNTTEYTSKELWDNLEKTSGISTAMNLLSNKIVKETETYKKISDDKEKTDLYYDNLNALLSNFAANQLGGYGYDSSIGKYNFLKLYFHTTDIPTIIDNYYRVNTAKGLLMTDYTDTALADTLKIYSDNHFNKYFSMDATNLLVYVDMNEDGTEDRVAHTEQTADETEGLFWWGKTVDGTEGKTYAELANELINDIINLTKYSHSTAKDAIAEIVTEYNSSSRFTNGIDEEPSGKDDEKQYDPTQPEKYWAKYRKAGLYIKTNEYTGVTNTTDNATIPDVLKVALYKAFRDEAIYDKDTVPTEYMLKSYYENGNTGLFSENGYNLLTMTSASINKSAEFTAEDDTDSIYTNLVYKYNENYVKISDLYSEGDSLSTNQIIAFLIEQATSSSVTLPTDVSTALTTYLQPVYTRYTSETTQFMLQMSFIKSHASNKDFVFGTTNSTASKDKLDDVIALSKRTTDGYMVTSTVYKDSCTFTFFNDKNDKTYFEIQDLFEVSSTQNWWTSLEDFINSKEAK